MENAKQEQVRQWVAEQTARLDPPSGWQPDPAAALMRFHARAATHPKPVVWRRWPVWVAAAAVLTVIFLLLPWGRVMAQQFWQYLTVRQVAFIRVNPWPDDVPSPVVKLIGLPIPPIPASNLDQASTRVRFTARLPHAFVFSESPKLSTTFSMAAGTVVKVADLELALRKAGITDQTVPPQWDGAQVALHTSAMVIAEWPDVVLVQSQPLTLTAPASFDFAAYSALVLRIMGVSPYEAQRLAQQMGTAPPWLAPISRDLRAGETIEQVTLNSGPATLVQEPPAVNGTKSRITICWSVPDRVYLLNGYISRELAIIAANAVQ
jgi:hypothetical protein